MLQIMANLEKKETTFIEIMFENTINKIILIC